MKKFSDLEKKTIFFPMNESRGADVPKTQAFLANAAWVSSSPSRID